MKEEFEQFKKEQNKRIKKYFVFITITAIVLGVTTGVGAYQMSAKEINFTPSNNKWKVNNVADAISDLQNMKTSDNYSTDEQVVGTWIDGKPVYQRVITGFNVVAPGRNWGTLYSNSSLANCELKNIIGYGSGYFVLPYFEGGVGSNCFWEILKKGGFKTISNHGKHEDFYNIYRG